MKTNKTNMENLKKILSVNKSALRHLHYFKGFDFEKPFNIVAEESYFTVRSFKKAIKDNVDNVEDYEFALLFIYTIGVQTRLYFVDVKDNFVLNVKNPENYNYINSFNMDYFNTKKHFGEVTKASPLKWFLVIQKKEYLTPAERLEKIKTVDYSERFVRTLFRKSALRFKKCSYKLYRQSLNGAGSIKDINGICFKNSSDNRFDKSGYFLNNIRDSYKARAEELRHKRGKDSNFDGLTKAYEMNKKIDELLPLIIELINQKDFDKVTDIFASPANFSKLHKKINTHIEKLENKSFQSVSDIKASISDIEKMYDNIKSIIEKK